MASLLIEPGLGAGGVGDELLGLEPQVDLGLGVLQGVAAVDDVPEKTDEDGHEIRRSDKSFTEHFTAHYENTADV